MQTQESPDSLEKWVNTTLYSCTSFDVGVQQIESKRIGGKEEGQR